MSPQLDAALTTVSWCVTLYFAMLIADAAFRLFTRIYAMFKHNEERVIDEQISREYIAAVTKLAESQKRDQEPQ